MTEKILLVDDEENVLAGLKRHLGNRFEVTTASNFDEALKRVQNDGPFAVVVCDMRMPGKDGIETLAAIEALAADTVRMMLTGNADQQTAVDAINEGHIFRFFNKPCSMEVLSGGIEGGLKQYRLVVAERELLEKTLAGSVKVLTDVLTLMDPAIYGRASRVREWTRAVIKEVAFPSPWQLDLAAMLAPIGRIAVPPEILVKERAGDPLTDEERDIITRVPEMGADLISNIPRMREVAEIVHYQDKNFDGSGFPDDDMAGEDIPFGARILGILNRLGVDTITLQPTTAEFDRLGEETGAVDPTLLAEIRSCLNPSNKSKNDEGDRLQVEVYMLRPNDILCGDISLEDGKLLLAGGMQLTSAQIGRLRNINQIHRIARPVEILRPPKEETP